MAAGKRIELFLKGKLNKFLSGSNNPEVIKAPTKLFHPGNIRKILLLRQDRIGDLLISTSFVRHLRGLLPSTRIEIVLGRKNISARSAVERYVDRILLYDKRIFNTYLLIKHIRKEKYDLVIDMLDNQSSTSSYLVKFSGAQQKLGFEKENSRIYTHVVPIPDKESCHIIDRLSRLLIPFGIEPGRDELSPEYHLSTDTLANAEMKLGKKNSFRLGINLSGSDRAKYWGTKNNIEFINNYNRIKPGYEILIFSTGDYQTELQAIISSTDAKAAPAAESFDEFAAMLSTCDLIITPDTSAVHLAAAFKIPCLAMYNKIENHGGLPWFPYNSKYEALISTSGSLESISPEDVLNAIENLLKA